MLIGTFEIPPNAVALDSTLEDVPEVVVEAERIAAHGTKWTMPCLWVANAEFDAVDEALENDPTVEEVVDTATFDDEKYYQIEWTEPVIERINSYLDREASLLQASANSDGWRVQIRFGTRDQFDTFREYLSDEDYQFRMLQLTEPGAPRQTFGGVTPDQREALVAAMERGYYRVPREITARELADELDMSHQSVSETLRRGTENIIDATLTTEDESPKGDI
jgi:predicted DNA binding protein